jgi:hypothetical protein
MVLCRVRIDRSHCPKSQLYERLETTIIPKAHRTWEGGIQVQGLRVEQPSELSDGQWLGSSHKRLGRRVTTKTHHLPPASLPPAEALMDVSPDRAEALMDAPASSHIDSIPWDPSHWTIVSPSWKGFSEIRYLFILYGIFAPALRVSPPHADRLPKYAVYQYSHKSFSGDSYSETVGRYSAPQRTPTDEFPLGVPWPGDTYSGEPNWVGLRYACCLKSFDCP